MEGLITGSKITTAEAGGLASFTKSTLVGAVHISERGRRHTPASNPDRLTAVRHWMSWHSNRGGASPPPGVKQAEVEAVRPCYRHLWGVEMGTVIESLIRQNGQNVLKLVAIADGLNDSQVSRDHRQGPGHREMDDYDVIDDYDDDDKRNREIKKYL
ncbi:hypothetical protein PPACK8108_LOCUS23989 [Phakopsora pachyrhizi]|uniref:Uncharacterized protein n=1 Tax=Phakopsora pachyrhizi TaxID=170000 RepID=A0AAV0BRT5_PHAPC|nr:hypothetical protein PPACK8108_LOCUS23989 [Phakopsora pachyrhizi]